MTAAELRAKNQRLKEEVIAVREYWANILPDEFLPTVSQVQIWLSLYGGLDNVIAGMERTAVWLQQREQKSAEREAQAKPPLPAKSKVDVIKYASGVMNNLHKGINPMDGTTTDNAEEQL